MINGSVHAGPNAIFALAREGYTKLTINPRDVLDGLRWPGLWRVGESGSGVPDSRRRRDRCQAFPCEPAQTRPELPDDSLVPTHAGVRAQALHRDGRLVDDFYCSGRHVRSMY